MTEYYVLNVDESNVVNGPFKSVKDAMGDANRFEPPGARLLLLKPVGERSSKATYEHTWNVEENA